MLVAALIGFAFGFIGSMPVAGPIAILVFSRGVEGRFRSGLGIAAGGAVAEGAYAALAFWGFSALLARYAFVEPVSQAVAALILAGLGVAFLRRRHGAKVQPAPDRLGTGSVVLGFTICALNPTLIVTWTAAVTILFSTGLVTFVSWLAIPFALAAVAGIVSWFVVLLAILRRTRHRFRPQTLDAVIRAMGLLVLGLSVVFVVRLVLRLS